MRDMLAHDEVSVMCRAAIGGKSDAEVGIVVGDSDEMLSYLNIVLHLLEQFTVQGLLPGLPHLNLSTRELPMMTSVGESSFTLLHAQDFALMLYDCRNNNHVYNSSAS